MSPDQASSGGTEEPQKGDGSSGAGAGQPIEVAAKPALQPTLGSDVSLKAVLYQNTEQTLILVTQDKLELAFQKDAPRYARRLGWATPLGLLLAFLVVLVSANFKHEVLSAKAWEVIFIVGAIVFFVWFVVEAVQGLKTPRRLDVTRSFVEKVRGDGAASPIDFV